MKEGLLELGTAAGRSHARSLNQFVTNLPNRAGANQAAAITGSFEHFWSLGTDSPFTFRDESLGVGLPVSGDYFSSWEADVAELPFARAASNNATAIGGVQRLAGRLADRSSISSVLNKELVYASRFVSQEFAAKVQELLALLPDWDGDGASPVRVEELARVVSLMRVLKQIVVGYSAPFVAPTFNGSVLLDWAGPRRTLEIQYESGHWSIVGTSSSRNNERNYYTGKSLTDFGVAPYYEWFWGDLLIWPTQ